ncbi:MAG: hypothetical protein A2151_01570 [Candidatus Muproteobacteria bacterium RBG_16_65_34]|uniref:PilZ domain-containing protein n=1 Tax=Candidatus Muproteobacteria bacterium RBG_16_65_34 TaxID=1817760 RepID=A0A1F6TJX9_9PROT|nr:MAG: hypothetical protein A2151_01570 [Candidatus Muproteobacteria bacterium RBG_16_65_34]
MHKKTTNDNVPARGSATDHWMKSVAYERQYRDAAAHPGARPRDPGLNDRTEPRAKIPFTALVNYGLTYSAPWRVRDLSPNGAFVEMSTTDIPQGAFVEFVLRFAYKGRNVEHRLPAKVVRVEPNGVALGFGAYDDAAYTDIVNLLYAA